MVSLNFLPSTIGYAFYDKSLGSGYLLNGIQTNKCEEKHPALKEGNN